MVGDFVILRSDGMPVYNFCCVVDDWLMKMTHVIRAEEHLPNTLRQLMVYEALGAKAPEFAHVSLIVGNDRQKLSKRHGATSVTMFKENGYLPAGMLNYLVTLGWSHPEEKDIYDVAEMVKHFSLDRFNKAPAIFDYAKMDWVNGNHLRALPDEEIARLAPNYLPENHPALVLGLQDNKEWFLKATIALKNKIDIFKNFEKELDIFFSETLEEGPELSEILDWPTTPAIASYVEEELNKIPADKLFIGEQVLEEWLSHLKKEMKIKGKPLFMGLRGVLTGMAHGSELVQIIPLTPVAVLKKRVALIRTIKR
jgi:glutamyl-tRNA synthetase